MMINTNAPTITNNVLKNFMVTSLPIFLVVSFTFPRMDYIHLASGGVFFEDDLGFLVGFDELPESSYILHDPNTRRTCNASCGNTNRLWNNAFRKKI